MLGDKLLVRLLWLGRGLGPVLGGRLRLGVQARSLIRLLLLLIIRCLPQILGLLIRQ